MTTQHAPAPRADERSEDRLAAWGTARARPGGPTPTAAAGPRDGAAGGPAPRRARVRRELHPVAWWLWALGVAAGASATLNPLVLLGLAGCTTGVVLLRRSDQPWARSFRVYAWIALAVVLVRVLFRVLLGGGQGTVVWLPLPEVPLPDWVLGVGLLGDVTRESVLAGLYDGMRLATILLAVGAANSLANPRPPARLAAGRPLRGRHRPRGRRLDPAPARRQPPAGAPGPPAPPRSGGSRPRPAAHRRAGARGRPRPVRAPGGRHGRPRLRPLRRGEPPPARHDRRAGPDGPRRRLRRHVRRPRPHRPALARRAGAAGVRRARGRGHGQRRAARHPHPLPPRALAARRRRGGGLGRRRGGAAAAAGGHRPARRLPRPAHHPGRHHDGPRGRAAGPGARAARPAAPGRRRGAQPRSRADDEGSPP